MTTQISRTWRDSIAHQIEDPQEHQRLADAIGVRPITLTRWVQGINKPSMTKLALFLQVAPSSKELLPLLAAEFPAFKQRYQELTEETADIPAEFYYEILKASTVTGEAEHIRTTGMQILQHALDQLDPHAHGMTILTQLCQPVSTDGKVHSLRATLNIGTDPWLKAHENTAFFGAESLSGFSATHNRPIIIQDIQEKQDYPYPFQRSDHARSFCMYPLQRHHRIAGCLWFGSTQAHYFTTKRAILIERYANLLQVIFPSSAFYDLQQIQLQVMPTIKQQQPILATVVPRIQQILRTSAQSQQPIPYPRAEHIVWQQLENELIALAVESHS